MPKPLHSHGLRGRVHVAVPSAQEVQASPVRWHTGGRWSPATNPRANSIPLWVSQYAWSSTSPTTGRRNGSGVPSSAGVGGGSCHPPSSTNMPREVPCASRRPWPSSSEALEMPCVRVECSSRARPTIAALEVVAGRTKSSAISALATPNPAGAAVRMAAPRGPSATKASAPARKTPSAADCHHGEAGIAMAAVPIPTLGHPQVGEPGQLAARGRAARAWRAAAPGRPGARARTGRSCRGTAPRRRVRCPRA